jgi:hypothetical protein
MISIIVAIYLVRVAISLQNILRDPLPHPADAILLSIFFYNAPLALISIYNLEWLFPDYKVFLNAESRDSYLAEKTMIICFVSMIGLEMGRRLFFKYKMSERYIVMDNSFSNFSLIIIIAMSSIILSAAYAMGFGNYFVGYNIDTNVINVSDYIAFIYFCIEAVGIFFLFVFVNKKFGNRKFILIVLFILISYIVFMALARGKRLELVVALLPLMLLFWSVKLRSVSTRMFVAVGFLLAFSSLASLRFGEIPTLSALFFNSFSEGLYAGHMTPGVINAIDYQGMRPELGARFGIGFLAIIPRFMFPGKDQIVYQSITDITEFTPLGATSLLGETYLQGGTLFVLLAFIGFGFLSRLFEVDRLYEKGSKYFPLKSIYYLIFMGTFLFHFRDGIVVMVKLTLQMVIVVSLFRVFLSHQMLNVQRTGTARSNQW